ncbi:CHAT domain-containing protein [Cystobacter fuscus]|uniref:CHAT domain-containing protein n=1 Tax=Cystobacter fuscus TaxID=43 RepID=UPI002B2D73C9|nr:CHAT domain-containing protein [Cystobacter fuscus]
MRLDEALLQALLPHLGGLEPLPRLVLCLQLVRGLEGTPRVAHWTLFARVAIEAIYDLGRLEFFPLRLTLIDELLATEPPDEDKADLFFRRGNTRLALGPENPALLDSAIQDLEEAARLAHVRGFALVELKAECSLARAVFLELPGRPALASSRDSLVHRLSRLEALLPHAGPLGMASDVHEILSELEGRGILSGLEGASSRAIHHARRAAELTKEPVDRASRLASLAQLLFLHGAPEQRASAVEVARQAVMTLPPEAGDIHSAQPHAMLGEALRRDGQAAEAIGHFEYALRLLSRQAPNANRNLIRLHLAQALLAEKRPEDARHHLQLVFDEAHAIWDGSNLCDATQLLVGFDHANGQEDVARARLLKAEARLVGTPAQTLLTLIRLRSNHPGSAPSAEFIDFVRRYLAGQLPTDEASDGQLQHAVANQARHLPPDIRRQLLATGRHLIRDVALRAQLLEAEERKQEAIDELREVLARSREPQERLSAAALLITLLPQEARDERLRWCDEVETSLEGSEENPATRVDLAKALWIVGRRDKGLLERAWRHVERAARYPDSDFKTTVFIARTRAMIRLDQVSLHAMEFAPATRELASWFTRELPLPGEEYSDYRCHVLKCLLISGPLTPPETLELAERLLGLIPRTDKSRLLGVRLQWIRACLASPHEPPARPGDLPGEYQGDFDQLPGWAVALAQGAAPRRDEPLTSEVRGMAMAVLHVRSDRAEAVLEWLFSRESDPHGLDSLTDEVAQSSPAAMLRGLLETVEKLVAGKPSFRLLRLRVALRRRLASSGEVPAYTQAVDALLPFARTAEERVEAKLSKGIERMDVGRFEEARPILEEALVEARSAGLSAWTLFPLLVSTGNTYRKGREPDIERALTLYAEAEALGRLKKDADAQLWKVKADALLERGRGDDAVQALVLLTRALEIRTTGFLRVETLLSAARAERDQPGRDESFRLRRALDRLDEAERHAEGMYLPMVASAQTRVLARLIRLQPKDLTLQRRLERIGQRHPELADDVKNAMRGQVSVISMDAAEPISSFVSHPAGNAFLNATASLSVPDPAMMEKMARAMGEDPVEARQRYERTFQEEDRSPRAIREQADRLAHVDDAQARPGATLGRAVLLAHLAEHGLASPEEVERVIHEAEPLIRGLAEAEVRSLLMIELAGVWAPENHLYHPIRDFRRAAELAREVSAVNVAGGAIARQALRLLARATRYRTDGDLDTNLREAERLYEQCVREYMAAGERDVALHAQLNLTEVRIARGAGDPLVNLQEGILAARQLLDEGLSPVRMAKTRLSLAVYQTMLGTRQPSTQARTTLLEARVTFESIDRSLLSASERTSADNYRTICLADLVLGEGRHEDAILLWRQRLAALDVDAPMDVRAYTTHNLADMLLRHGTHPVQLMEGLALSEECLAVRTLEANPVHHWETRENIGRGVALLLLSSPGAGALSAAFARQLWEQGWRALRGAFAAARKLGSHHRLFRSASRLLDLARAAPSLSELEKAADEGWSALDEARPYLLLDEEAGAEEARLAAQMAATLARGLAERGVVGVSSGLGFVLSGERAQLVLRWMVRAAGAAQRRLAGRTARPEGVPSAIWVEWLAASRSGDERLIGRTLDALRTHVPLFLRGEPDLEGTWNWLRLHPGAAVVAVVGSSSGMMAAVLTQDEQRQVSIATLDVDAPPHEEEAVARSLSARGPGAEYLALLEWARRGILAPLERLLPRTPSQLLWVPTGVLRVLAPADLWPSVPVTCAVRLDLETRAPPPRPRRTLLAVADPGPDAGPGREIPDSVEMGASLAHVAQEGGPLRVRMSRGAKWGQALGIPCPELVEGPASPDELIRELAGVDVAVLLCHGEVDGPRDARLLLVDGTGTVAPLHMQRLADDPHLVAGMSIVLLSCETGRVGDWLHQAAGLAGAMLAGGARNVIAPLWPVLLEPAWEVGRTVLDALRRQEDLSAALLGLSAPEQGAALGRRVRGGGAGKQAWSLRAFVRWVG